MLRHFTSVAYAINPIFHMKDTKAFDTYPRHAMYSI